MATPKKPTKAAAKKSDTKAPSAATGASSPLIDTANAAKSAAALLAARGNKVLGTKPESASFKKLKEGLAGGVVPTSSLLSGGGSLNKSNSHAGFAKQVGHNQTAGANLSRTGVPRRTSTG